MKLQILVLWNDFELAKLNGRDNRTSVVIFLGLTVSFYFFLSWIRYFEVLAFCPFKVKKLHNLLLMFRRTYSCLVFLCQDKNTWRGHYYSFSCWCNWRSLIKSLVTFSAMWICLFLSIRCTLPPYPPKVLLSLYI